jgi:molybdenum cofactor cytidylyltransferase
MDLKFALRLGSHPSVAFVGAGGKTTALFRLARQFTGPVFVSSSTHFATNQLDFADTHLVIEQPGDIPHYVKGELEGITVFTGTQSKGDRTDGLNIQSLEQLDTLARNFNIPLLLEADGSRQLPMKAPADHEPAIPDFVDMVIVVTGLSALGQPLDGNKVHRPEIFASLSEIQPGGIITPEGLVKVLISPNGGLKHIPAGSQRVVLLNQADTSELARRGKEIAERLMPHYHSVLVGSLAPPDSSLSEVFAVHEQVGGVIIAAGGSNRLGKPKQLLQWRGQSFIRRVTLTALEAGLSPVIVVLGAYADLVKPEINDLPVDICINLDWEKGQSTSLKVGLRKLPRKCSSSVMMLVDQPQVPSKIIMDLIETHSQSLAPIVAPKIVGKRGNPVLFDKNTFPGLMRVTGDIGGRSIFSDYPVSWLQYSDESLRLDVDTLEDYQRLLEFQ